MARRDGDEELDRRPMIGPAVVDLDDIDRGILFALQQDARNLTTTEIGEVVGVSASTVRNRIEKLEGAGVIRGYAPHIDYERAGYQLHAMFVCTVPAQRREAMARKMLDFRGVVDVRELLTGERNLYIEIVAKNTRDLAEITNQISEQGIKIVSSELVTNHYRQPFGSFESE